MATSANGQPRTRLYMLFDEWLAMRRNHSALRSILLALLLAQSFSTHAEGSVVLLYDPCQHESDYLARGVAAARNDIQSGMLRLVVYVGGAPADPQPGEVNEARIRARLLGEHGVQAEVRWSSDVRDCARDPYFEAYQSEMWKAVEARYGARVWQDIDRETKSLVKHRLISPMASSPQQSTAR